MSMAIRMDLSNILDNPYADKGEKVTFDPKKVYDFEPAEDTG